MLRAVWEAPSARAFERFDEKHEHDSAPFVPRSVVVADDFDWAAPRDDAESETRSRHCGSKPASPTGHPGGSRQRERGTAAASLVWSCCSPAPRLSGLWLDPHGGKVFALRASHGCLRRLSIA